MSLGSPRRIDPESSVFIKQPELFNSGFLLFFASLKTSKYIYTRIINNFIN